MAIRIMLLAVMLLAQSAAWANPDIEHWTMRNGVRVYFVASHDLPMVNVRVVFDAGSARDGKGRNGLSSLTGTLLDEGAGPYNTGQIAARFEGLGAEFSASAGRDMAAVTLRSLSNPRMLHAAVDMMALVIRRPTFPQSSFQRERSRALIGIKRSQAQPRSIAAKAFLKQVYGDHPYALGSLQDARAVQLLKRRDLAAFHKQYYVGRNAVLVMVGDLTRKQAEALASRLLGKLSAGRAAKPLPPARMLQSAKRKEIRFPSSQSYIYFGAVGVRRGDPDYFPLYVGNHILGGGGLVSRLTDEVREKRGLTYSVYSYFSPLRQQGPFLMSLQTKNETRKQAFDVMRDTFLKFHREGPTKKELIAAKKNLTGKFPLSIDNNRKITGYLALIGFYRLPLNHMDQVIDKINAVTLAQIRDAFHRRVHPDKFVAVVVGGEIKKKP